tara:strand:- start:119 stop:316 length:198 start_codon:yes stop_codon:yes gene_type:complete
MLIQNNKMNEIVERICPLTIILNLSAVSISLLDVEMGLKIASYSVAVIWTLIKIIKELKNWNGKL